MPPGSKRSRSSRPPRRPAPSAPGAATNCSPRAARSMRGSAPPATGPVAGHLDRVMSGKAGTAMQAFGKQLSDVEIAGVITYERNSFDNNVGDVVQPAQVKLARK